VSLLYVPTDVDEAHDAWKANCGPCAVAALLGREVNAVRELFEPWPGYTNPTKIREALKRAGKMCVPTSAEALHTSGLGFIQFEGPWEAGGARAAYRHTHWVALARRFAVVPDPTTGLDQPPQPHLFVYDAAVCDQGGWILLDFFSRRIIPLYLEDQPKATGWGFRLVLEVV